MNLLDEIEANLDQQEDLRLALHNKKKYLKSKFCGWKTPAWTTTKQGKRVHGYNRLQTHISLEHPEEFEKALEELDVNDAL